VADLQLKAMSKKQTEEITATEAGQQTLNGEMGPPCAPPLLFPIEGVKAHKAIVEAINAEEGK